MEDGQVASRRLHVCHAESVKEVNRRLMVTSFKEGLEWEILITLESEGSRIDK